MIRSQIELFSGGSTGLLLILGRCTSCNLLSHLGDAIVGRRRYFLELVKSVFKNLHLGHKHLPSIGLKIQILQDLQ
jgi:hypothetical protein